MFNFFVQKENISNGIIHIDGGDFNHIKNVLRMKEGDTFLVSVDGKSHLSKIESFADNKVIAKVIEENYLDTSLPVEIHLFQALPKADKLELTETPSKTPAAVVIAIAAIVVAAVLAVSLCCPELLADFVRWIISAVIGG